MTLIASKSFLLAVSDGGVCAGEERLKIVLRGLLHARARVVTEGGLGPLWSTRRDLPW